MIEAVEAYIENIVALMIITALAEMIMPESSFKKYARLISGLVIVVAVTEPAMEMLYGRGFDFELKEIYSSVNSGGQKQTVNDIYIKELENRCFIVAEQTGIEISDIKIKNGRERIDEVVIYIKPPHSCAERAGAYNGRAEGCGECENTADALKGTVTSAMGVEKVDVIVLDE